MKLKHCRLGVLLFVLFYNAIVSSKEIEIISSLQNENRVLDSTVDLFLTDKNTPMRNSTVDIVSPEAWLFFENMKPSGVLGKYKSSIKINGESIDPVTNINCRIVVYKQGSVVIPLLKGFKPLETFTETDFLGNTQSHFESQYYTNNPYKEIPLDMIDVLENDNAIRSFKLKRGYMVTFANESDGMGYSRCFIADEADLEISQLPVELDEKISFVRVFPWEWVSKKGWVGTYWEGVDEGLRYVDQQADLTNSTWYYTWGSNVYGSSNATETTLMNQEFVPEKWGKGGSVRSFFKNKRWSHLIGQNEPDHVEQSNVTVQEAIEEWPTLMKTGARLGTPATTDFNWLYQFMDECKERNYRVDFVVVHGYWGSKSPLSWFNDLKKLHERTGRPIWIKEWNNGANWTGESWPNGSKGDRPYTEANANKMLNDLKGILQVMDTASFMERYSIYNWVEDARAIILRNGSGYGKGSALTKAGEYYAQNSPGFAFNRDKEVVPAWKMHPAKLSCSFSVVENKLKLSWDDTNGELTVKYNIERSLDREKWESIDEINSTYINEYLTEVLSSDEIPSQEMYYRLRTTGYNGTEKISNEVKYDVIKNQKQTPITVSNLKVKNEWSISFFEKKLQGDIISILGIPSFKNRYPLTARTRNVNNQSVEIQLRTWDYLNNPNFIHSDTLAFMAIERGAHQFGAIKLIADTVSNVGKTWKNVTFETPFDEVPVVLTTQISANDLTASAVRIKNITKTGFDIVRKYESGKSNIFEDISYIAATPGTGVYDERNLIEVGVTSCLTGISYSKSATIQFENVFENPAFFGSMQTCNDESAATLRLRSKSGTKVEVFKEKEKSITSADPKAEKIGWLVLGSNIASTPIHHITDSKHNSIVFESNTGNIYLTDNRLMNKVDVYSVPGTKILSGLREHQLNVASLQTGIYIVVVDDSEILKFIK